MTTGTKEKVLLALVLAAAFAVRVYGNGFGLPDQLNIDEVHVVSHAIRFGKGDFNPHFFFYPALQMYLVFILYGFYFVFGMAAGIFQGAADFGTIYFIDPTPLYLIARTFTAAMGVATVWLVYATAKKYYGTRAGLASAVMLAFAHLHCMHSHFATTDVPAAFWIMLAMYLVPGPGSAPSRKQHIITGLATGAAIATKYTAFIVVPALVAAHSAHLVSDLKIRNPLKHINLNLVLMGAAAVAGFIVCAPYTILDFNTFIGDVRIQRSLLEHGWLGTEVMERMWWRILAVYLRDGMGLPLLFCSLCGVAYAAVRRRGADWMLLVFTAVFYIIHGFMSEQVFERYMILVIPALCIFAGRLVAELSERLPGDAGRHGAAVAVAAAVALIIVPAVSTLKYDSFIRRKHTRTIAREWIEDNIPSGSRIAVELGGPTLQPTPESLTDNARMARYDEYYVREAVPFFAYKDRETPEAEAASTKQFHLRALEKIDTKYYLFGPYSLSAYKMEMYRKEDYEYLVASGAIYDRYFAAREHYPAAVGFYESLDSEAELVKTIPRTPDRPGPEIKIYRLPSNLNE